MKRRSNPHGETPGDNPTSPDDDWDDVQARIIGLGERSVRKTYYPQLRERIDELERFRGLLDQTPDVILMVDAQDWVVVDSNRAALRRLGHNHLLGRALDQVLPVSAVEELKVLDGVALSPTLEIPLGQGNDVYPAEITFRKVVLGGKVFGVVVARDISKRKDYERRLERKAAEEAALGAVLRLSLEPMALDEYLRVALAMLLGSIPWLKLLPSAGVFLSDTDKDGQRHLRLVAQHGLDPMVQKSCSKVAFGECLCGAAAENGKIQYASCIDERHTIHYEGMAEHGHYNVPFFDHGETLGVIVFYLPHDHSRSAEDEAFLRRVSDALSMGVQARKSEIELNKTVDELGSSQDDLARLAFIASHDLQYPLHKILSHAQKLERTLNVGADGDAESLQHLSALLDNAKSLGSLVGGLLDYTQVSARSQPFAEFDLQDVLHEVLDDFDLEITAANMAVVVGDLPRIWGDRDQIRKVLENLLSNAIQYRCPACPPQIQITAIQDESCWHITLKDNGIGIDKEYWDKIFEPFQRLHASSEHPGTGIGLALVRKIVDRHGGKVMVQSTPGEGSRFTFTLPLGGA